MFQLRDKANPDMEKPFLEHLEDLRIAITRIVVTLLVSTVACFVLRDELMEILRRPVEQVWMINQASRLPAASEIPKPVDVETWEHAKKIADSIAGLDSAGREVFLSHLGDPDLRFHVETVFLYRAALELPKERREAFLAALPDLPAVARQQVKGLLEKEPSARIEDRDDLRLMGAFNPTEAFMLSIKLAFFAGIVVSFPLLLFFILQFVLPGLHKHEKKALFPAMAIGFGLFLVGVLFAYFIVLPRVLEFFFSYAREMGIANEWRIGYYISFATQFTLIFGLAFELPVVVMTLVKIGLLGYETMRKTRSYAILAIFVIAAVITPTPDAFTLCLLAVPMIVLYEICIWLAWGIHRKQVEREAAEEKERMERLLDEPAPASDAAGETQEGGEAAPDAASEAPDTSGMRDTSDTADTPAGADAPDSPAADEAGETEDRGDPWSYHSADPEALSEPPPETAPPETAEESAAVPAPDEHPASGDEETGQTPKAPPPAAD